MTGTSTIDTLYVKDSTFTDDGGLGRFMVFSTKAKANICPTNNKFIQQS